MEIQAYFRRLARTATLVVAGALSLSGVAGAQAPPAVTTGSIIPIPHTLYNQIYKILYWHGYVLALDTANSVLYQMSPGSPTLTSIYTGTATTPMGAATSFWTEDMTIDNEGNLYLGQRYATPPMFWRIPFNSGSETWSVTTNDAWGENISDSSGNNLVGDGSSTLAFLDSGDGNGSGTLYWMQETVNGIYKQQVDGTGNPTGAAVAIVTGLLTNDGKMTVDANGNIYFVENPGVSDAKRVNGVLVIPAGSTGLVGEAALTNLIPPSYAATNKFNGVSLDAAGNMYLSSEANDGYGGEFNGDFMIPNTCGKSQADVIDPSTCYNWSNASYISPVSSNSFIMADPRGFLWIPHYGDFAFPGSNTYGGSDNTTTNFCTGGACNFVVWQPGSDNLGAAAVGTASATGTVFVNFNTAETLTNIGFSQPGTGSDFATTTTNPYALTGTTNPTLPCATATTTPYEPQTSCPLWLKMTPRTVGTVSGELTMTDSSGAVSGSTTYLGGLGEGPLAALLGMPTQIAMATGLSTPAQVAVDTQGNVYVADPGLGQVREYAAGSSGAAGQSIGTGLKKPTGVAVDGSGDVYIGDSGKIYEIPFVNGQLDQAGQVTLVTNNSDSKSPMPLGNHLNLAVDGLGDVFVADVDNKQVVEIGNPQTAATQNSYSVVVPTTTAFKSPSAVAVDGSGDLFVADGVNLYEITPWSEQSLIDSNLSGVTGLAVEPSGSVDVAEANEILRIPSLGGSITSNDAAVIDSALTAPQGVAIDNQGNLYVTDMTGGTPNLFELNTTTDGSYNFGQQGAYIPTEQDVTVYNVGNEALSFSADPTFGGTDSGDLTLTTPNASSQCDTSTTTESGGTCAWGLQFDALGIGTRSGSMSITSSGENGTVTANFTADALLTLEPTAATISLSPTTSTFPGSTTATVTITQAPLSGYSTTTNVPSGPVTVTLSSSVVGSTQPPIQVSGTATGTDTSTTAVINVTNIPGGAYNVRAQYKGNPNYGGTTAATTLIVAQAPPMVTVTEPSGIQPDQFNGVYYLLAGSTSTLTVTVTSPLTPSPTGTVTFMNGTAVADPTQGVQGAQPLDAHGQAVFSLSNLAAGTYSLTAVYSGDSNYATVTSTPVTFQVLALPSVLITSNPTSVSTTAGSPVSSTLTLESLVGFSATGGANITCDNSTLPAYSECTFNNPQPALCAAPGQPSTNCYSTTTTVVTISSNIPTNIPTSARGLPPETSGFALAGVLGLGLLGLGLRKRKLISQGLFQVVCLTLLLAGSVVGFTGCTNSGYTHTPPAPHYVTPSGTYKVSIIVTDEASGAQDSLPFTIPVTVK
ncbi:MAG TPA: Ig-like domain repeat protein [Acidobacteriaceae bacterium]|nr:Ig-like domain repeat protein [Acidobacteriaceae bacterium]